MRFYTLHGDANNWNHNIGFLETIMFHGEARPNPGKPGSPSNNIGELNMSPLRLIVNAYQLSDILLPNFSSTLVVSERVVESIRPHFKDLYFYQIQFSKVYLMPWNIESKSDFIYPTNVQELCADGKEFSVHKEFKHDRILSRSLPPYYEIVTYNHYQLLEKYADSITFCAELTKSKILRLPQVSQNLFKDHPITDAGYPLIRSDLFDLLKLHINANYFGITEHEFC